MQFTFAKHQEEAPKFYTSRYRHFNNPSAPAGYSSYIEGWGLYAESLGHQMDGIYDRDNQIFPDQLRSFKGLAMRATSFPFPPFIYYETDYNGRNVSSGIEVHTNNLSIVKKWYILISWGSRATWETSTRPCLWILGT